MYVQEYLKNANVYTKKQALEELEKDFGIKAKIYDDFVVLNYSQIDSPKTDPIVLECRGLILDLDWNVLRRPFDRFFNYEEADTQDFDFKNSVCMEKLDGSIIPAWWNPFEKRWCFGTRGTAFAECECNSGRMFFEIIDDCFQKASKETVAKELFYKKWTYIFELCSPENRVVVPYTETSLVLIGVRMNDSGEYVNLTLMSLIVEKMKELGVNVRLPQLYEINEIDKIKRTFDDSGAFFEGYVFWNRAFEQRVKIKNPAYLIKHRLRNNGILTLKNAIEIVLINEVDECLSVFPEKKKTFDDIHTILNNIYEEMDEEWNKLKNIENQKDFALKVKDMPLSSIFFKAKSLKIHPRVVFDSMDIDKKIKLILKF